MGVRMKLTGTFAALLAAGIGWAALQSPLTGSAPDLEQDSRRVVFVVDYDPLWEDGGPGAVPFSWGVGSGGRLTAGNDGEVAHRRTTRTAKAEPGMRASLAAVPARKPASAGGPERVPTVTCEIIWRGHTYTDSHTGWNGCGLSIILTT